MSATATVTGVAAEALKKGEAKSTADRRLGKERHVGEREVVR
jgi:hypothetical protein